jgi:hypothetical protein
LISTFVQFIPLPQSLSLCKEACTLLAAMLVIKPAVIIAAGEVAN